MKRKYIILNFLLLFGCSLSTDSDISNSNQVEFHETSFEQLLESPDLLNYENLSQSNVSA
jgi:hypothetical protein